MRQGTTHVACEPPLGRRVDPTLPHTTLGPFPAAQLLSRRGHIAWGRAAARARRWVALPPLKSGHTCPRLCCAPVWALAAGRQSCRGLRIARCCGRSRCIACHRAGSRRLRRGCRACWARPAGVELSSCCCLEPTCAGHCCRALWSRIQLCIQAVGVRDAPRARHARRKEGCSQRCHLGCGRRRQARWSRPLGHRQARAVQWSKGCTMQLKGARWRAGRSRGCRGERTPGSRRTAGTARGARSRVRLPASRYQNLAR